MRAESGVNELVWGLVIHLPQQAFQIKVCVKTGFYFHFTVFYFPLTLSISVSPSLFPPKSVCNIPVLLAFNFLNYQQSMPKRNIILLIALIGSATLLSACDAMLSMPYVVKNKTAKPLRLKVEDYPEHVRPRQEGKDTIILLMPNESINVGWASGIGFPWETKKLYRNDPGIENFSLISADSVLTVDRSQKYWDYRNGESHFSVTESRIKVK